MSDAATLPQMTTERAVSVINAAIKWHAYPEGAMPESDQEKVSVASSFVELARQQKRVADELGRGNVPAYDGIVEVLQEAGVDLETMPPAVEATAQAQAPVGQLATPVVEQAVQEQPSAAGVVEEQQRIDDAQRRLKDAAASGHSQVSSVEEQVWADADGGQWIVMCSELDQESVDARSFQTGEVTLLPRELLKHRVDGPGHPATPEQVVSTQPVLIERPPAQVTGPSSGPAPAQEAIHPPPTVLDDEGDEDYRKLLDETEVDYMPAGMPVPRDLENPGAFLSEDLTVISDIEQRRLHSHYNALSARARYLHNLEAARARACETVRGYRRRRLMPQARAQLGKDASLTEVIELAEQDPSVEPWIPRQKRHADLAVAYQTFFRMYAENVSVLSRDWTMRSVEEQGS